MNEAGRPALWCPPGAVSPVTQGAIVTGAGERRIGAAGSGPAGPQDGSAEEL